MGVKTSGSLSLTSDIVGEFGGSAPHSLSEYKRGGSYVPNISHNNNIPTTNSDIRFSEYYGTTSYVPSAQGFTSNGTYTLDASVTSIQYYISGGGGGGGRNQCTNCSPYCGQPGSATTLTFNTGQTITAAGGAQGCGTWSNQSACGGGNPNTARNFNSSGYPAPPWVPANPYGGTSAGGGGGGGYTDCYTGCWGMPGAGNSGTYAKPSGATSVSVSIGGGGYGGCQAGTGTAGAAWILGVQ